LNISFEQYQFEDEVTKSNVMKLLSLLQDKSMDKLIIELRRLEEPMHLLKDVIDQLESLLHSGRKDADDLIKVEWQSYISNHLRNDKKFGEKHLMQLQKIFGTNSQMHFLPICLHLN
jgi:hypothetical protein